MKSTLVGFAVILSLLTSCKDKETVNSPEEINKTEEVVSDNFTVQLSIVNPKNDSYVTYYTEDGTTNFVEDKAVWTDIVEGSNDVKKVTMVLPDVANPTQLRLDFGNNKEQETVELYNVKISAYGRSFEFKGSELYTYFSLNENVKTEIDEQKGTIKFLKNPEGFQVPMYYPMPKLVEEITKISQ